MSDRPPRGPDTGRTSPVQHTRPLTGERVLERIVALGHHVAADDDGDLFGQWGFDHFWFLRLGSRRTAFQVRGRWHRRLPPDRRADLLLALNDWNRDRIWPKAYLRPEDDGRLAVYAEVAVDLDQGVTDDQLDTVITRGLGAGRQLFDALESQLPEAEIL
jgi:hypothetical protein